MPPALGVVRIRRGIKGPTLFAWAVMIPMILFYLVFTGVPMVMAFVQSLESGDIVARVHPFVGLENYRYELTQDPTFYATVVNTVEFALATVAIGNIACLGLAMLVQRLKRGSSYLRAIFYMPSVLTPVALVALWLAILDTDNGVFNQVLRVAGLPRVHWLDSFTVALPSVVLMSVWWGLGGGMLVFLAGLQGVDANLYEAARMDGASPFRLFWHITLTQIRPLLVFQSIMGIIAGMQLFAQSYLSHTPGDATRSMVQYMYETAFSYGDIGTASAISFMLFALMLALVLAELWLLRKREQA